MNELLEQVRRLGLELSRHVPDYDLARVFEHTLVGAGKKGQLLDIDGQGRVVLNANHPLAAKLADGKPGRAELLVSAIVSLVNRAESELTDRHQRLIHRHLLATLVSGSA